MTGRREQLRESELANPRTSARSLNELVTSLQMRLERVERSDFFDMELTSGATGTMPAILLPRPTWKVRGVYLAKLYNVTTSAVETFATSLGWLVTNQGISVPEMLMTGTNTRYAITFEVRG